MSPDYSHLICTYSPRLLLLYYCSHCRPAPSPTFLFLVARAACFAWRAHLFDSSSWYDSTVNLSALSASPLYHVYPTFLRPSTTALLLFRLLRLTGSLQYHNKYFKCFFICSVVGPIFSCNNMFSSVHHLNDISPNYLPPKMCTPLINAVSATDLPVYYHRAGDDLPFVAVGGVCRPNLCHGDSFFPSSEYHQKKCLILFFSPFTPCLFG